jgi:ABC-type multidrug transport system fused ATPase/permease subunit
MNLSNEQKQHIPFFDILSWRYFLAFFHGNYKRLTVNAIFSAAQSLIVLPSLLLVRYAFDEVIPQRNINLLALIGIGLIVLKSSNSGISFWIRAVNIKIIRIAIFRLREDLLRRLYEFSRSFHTQADRNIIHARIVQDTERLSTMSDALVSRLAPSLFTSFALCLVLLFLNWFLLLVLISIFPALFIANRFIGAMIKKRVYMCQRAFERFSKGVFFVLQHIDLTRIQTAEDIEMKRQTDNLRELRATSEKMAVIYAVNSQVQGFLIGLSAIVIMIVGGAAVARKVMTIGEFLSFYMAAGFLSNHINTITASIPDIIAGNESMLTLRRLACGNDAPPYQGTKQIRFKGFLSLDSVSFRYDNQSVLENINLDLEPPCRVAIIGPNGAGKSTILHLILGFYHPCAGLLYADGVPYEDLDIPHLRKSIGVVMQKPALFSGTILENITYGLPGIDRQRVIHAAKSALADEFIEQLPNGYDTQAGDEGVRLSGGESQRIAIARALLRRPKLLILDEPTNYLDKETVKVLINNLEMLDDRPAILLISHDMDVVSHADKVFHLENKILRPYAPIPIIS